LTQTVVAHRPAATLTRLLPEIVEVEQRVLIK
jgi:hypothetical protein